MTTSTLLTTGVCDTMVPLRLRLVILGSGAVGKTAILRRFFNDEFVEKYRETVEDLHSRTYDVNGIVIQADVVDTAGHLSFPSMRRISISHAQAFLLVYSITDYESFEEICKIFKEIKEYRSDFRSVPIVVAGNKAELADQRRVLPQQIDQWLLQHGTECSVSHLDVSAKTGYHIREIFEEFVRLSHVLEVHKPLFSSSPSSSSSPRINRRLSLQPHLSPKPRYKRFSESSEGTPSTPPASRRTSISPTPPPGFSGSRTPTPTRRSLNILRLSKSDRASTRTPEKEIPECYVQ